VRAVALFLAHFEPRLSGFIARQRAAQDILGEGRLLRRVSFYVLAHPVANLTVVYGLFHDVNHLFVGNAGTFEPHAVEAFAEILLIIGMQFARQVQADFVNITWQVHPAIHGFARAARVNSVAHATIIQKGVPDFNVKATGQNLKFAFLQPASIFCRMQRFDYDVAILGGGSGGYAAARTAAGAGLKTVVIEGGGEVGGLCILRGCMPTKALLYAAEVMHLAGHPEPWGIRAGTVRFDFRKVMARKDRLIRDFADYRVKQLNAGNFEFIRANAKFLDEHTVELNSLCSSGRQSAHSSKLEIEQSRLTSAATLRSKNFVIATGSNVAAPPLPSLEETGHLTSDDALTLKRLPKSLIVLGGGAVACEFAQFFARFGVRVTLVQRSEHILKEFDSDAAAEIEKVFRREGVRVFTGTKLADARRKGKLKTVSFEHEGKMVSVSAGEILFALGRVPNTGSLALDKAGVKTENGRIITNGSMQTSAPHIYAAGDCTGPHEIVHLAVQQGEIAAHNLARPDSPRQMDYRLLISVVFTEPQVASVGLTEKGARSHGISYRAASYPFNDHGKSLIMEARDGFVKLLADPKSGEILGGTCVGPVGGELIHEIVTAMARRMTVHELAGMPHYHPTLAEIWTYPAEELAGQIA
jgi:pyruvate/2-oxoglutarate dehydrogenase complex dihydrolipoamide dehydrogenase (E3) component